MELSDVVGELETLYKDGYTKLENSAVSMRDLPNSDVSPAKRGWRCRVSVTAVLTFALWVASAVSQQPTAVTIQGKVSNANGASMTNVLVRLEHTGSLPVETKTNAGGNFTFGGVPPGDYTLNAEMAGHRSGTVTIHAQPSETQRVELIIGDANPAGGSSPGAAMEFADNPNFTIAAVTDWTAAGGHGSDVVLRTSEALNRETVNLKPIESHSAQGDEGSTLAEATLRAERAGAPQTFQPNYRLGEFYLRAGKYDLALQPLETAYKIDPGNFINEYELALALKGAGQNAQAREHVKRLSARQESADVYRLAGELDESLGDPLPAVREFERAARAEPTEQNYFEWGSELLLHRAVWQARDVFSAGAKAYPQSVRMLTALGAALFAGALYDEAAQRLCAASDLNPADPEPYRFMGKIEISAPNPLPCVEQRLARYASQRPADALADYFYAMALWKHKGPATDQPTLRHVEELLTTAVNADPKCSDAYLQLGVLKATRRDYPGAIEFYTKAIAANPQLSEAHYRLGIAYDRIGDKEKAAQQLHLHEEIEREQAAAVEKSRREVKQFLVVVDSKKTDSSMP